jgi:putative spermidine/putrescine transport system substrate-binding protein
VVFQPDSVQRAAAADLLQPLTAADIPNLAKLYPSVQEKFTKDGKTYAAAFSLGQLGLAYRTDLVKTPPKNWLDLWNPEYKGDFFTQLCRRSAILCRSHPCLGW